MRSSHIDDGNRVSLLNGDALPERRAPSDFAERPVDFTERATDIGHGPEGRGGISPFPDQMPQRDFSQLQNRLGETTSNLPPLPGGQAVALPPALPEAARQQEQSDEGPDYRDEQISELFTAMGHASQLTTGQLAQRLQTREDFIIALQEGALDKLPEWEEISVVVAHYAHFMNIDERPILRRLREKMTEFYLTSLSHKPLDVDENTFQFLPNTDSSIKAFAAGQLTGAEMTSQSIHQHDEARMIEKSTNAFAEKLQERPQNLGGLHHPHQDKPQNGFGGLHEHQHHKSQISNGLGKSAQEAQMRQLNQSHHHQQLQAGSGRLNKTQFQSNHLNTIQLASMKEPGEQHRQQVYQQPSGQQGSEHYSNYAYQEDPTPRKTFPYLKVAANLAFVIILLVGFVHWQPNRFWSGVDQLPKPISKTIYGLFEMVMPDPLASTYRMNWVFVDDPKLRKSDKLSLPKVKKISPLDFSKLGPFSQ